jgi:HNH endonuclease
MTARASDGPGALPVVTHLVVADDVLFGTCEEAAHLDRYGPIPAELARELVQTASDEATAQLRRLYVGPTTGELVAADSRSRCFPEGLGKLIELRDQMCRTPWCDAPIRHRDHPEPVRAGGTTSDRNGQGLCEACNYSKEAFGWRVRPSPGDRDTVLITTPAGRTYRSTAPPAPRWRPDVFYPVVLVA